MEVTRMKAYEVPVIESFVESIKELNLVYYASDVAKEMNMEFKDEREYGEAVKNAMDICLQTNIPIEGNFKKIYTCSCDGISNDWKLSEVAYMLFCLYGGTNFRIPIK